MNPNDLSSEFDKKITDYLNNNHPSPPPAPPFEFAQILRAIETHDRRRRFRDFLSARWLLPLATAALLIGFVVSRHWNPARMMRTSNDFLASSDSTWVYDEGSSELRSPSEDWLLLAQEISAQK